MTIFVLEQPLIWSGQSGWPVGLYPPSIPGEGVGTIIDVNALGGEYWFDMNGFDFEGFLADRLLVTYQFDAADLALDSLANSLDSEFWIDTKDLT